MTSIDSPPDFETDEPSYGDLFPAPTPPSDQEIDSWAPINLNSVADEPAIEPNLAHVGINILYPGKRHVFSGLPESAKTLAAYALLIQVIHQGGTIVLIDFEMGRRDAFQRLRELGATTTDIDHVLYIDPDEPATEARIQRLIDPQPTLVVIDAAAGAYDLEGLDDNKRQDVEKLSRLYVRRFWLAGIATLFIDHVVKNLETRGKFVIGSERKLGGADVHIGFETITPISRGTKGLYKLLTHKDRGGYLKRGHLANLELNGDPATDAIDWQFKPVQDETAAEGYFRPTHLMEKVSVWLGAQSEPVSRNAVADALGGTKEYVLKAITALVTEGFAAEESGPNRSKLVRSTRHFREDDPDCNPQNNPSGSVVRSGSAVVRQSDDASGSGGSLSRKGATTDPPSSTHEQNGTSGSAQPELPTDADADIPW